MAEASRRGVLGSASASRPCRRAARAELLHVLRLPDFDRRSDRRVLGAPFIEIGSRRLRFSLSTEAPDTAFVTQSARNLYMGEETPNVRFLIRDRDSKYASSFDEVFRTQGVRVIRTPIQAPNANTHSERSIRTIRQEVTNRLLIVGPRHLNLVLRGFARHYNSHRPHQGIDLQAPETIGVIPTPVPIHQIRRRRVVGGLISEYHARAA